MDNLNNVKTLFFAALRDRVGIRSLELQIPEQATVAGLKFLLVEKFPMFNWLMGHMLISVNQEDTFDETIMPESAEIAIFPPVSGG